MRLGRSLVAGCFAVALCALAGCVFAPSFGDGQVRCGSDGSCPPGLACGGDGFCHKGASSDGGSSRDQGACVPQHCWVGWCGVNSDGCGGTIDCGSCAIAGSDLAVTAPPVDMAGCQPTRACQPGSCGTLDDGCGKALSCGDCSQSNACSNTTPNSCVCTPKTCAGVGATCGVYPDGCGNLLDCFGDGGTCNKQGNGKCGGGGPYTCGSTQTCQKLTSCPAGACGQIPDGCVGYLKCRACPSGQICGGGGHPNVCG